MQRLLFLQYALMAVVIALFGLAAMGLLMWDFWFPGTFRAVSLFGGGMELNLVLLLAFGVQHSLMARRGFKKFLGRLMPSELVGSTYVMCSGFALFALALLWNPTFPPLYDLSGSFWGYLLLLGAALGAILIALAAFQMGDLDLLGLGIVRRLHFGEAKSAPVFRTPGVYRWARHPLYLGALMMFWLTPAMTHDHLFFAEVMTAYVMVGMWMEERDLIRTFGEAYLKYQSEVPMLFPFPRKKGK